MQESVGPTSESNFLANLGSHTHTELDHFITIDVLQLKRKSTWQFFSWINIGESFQFSYGEGNKEFSFAAQLWILKCHYLERRQQDAISFLKK